jgi:hypothetical protein
MNTAVVTFAQISFCSKFALLIYTCRSWYIAAEWILSAATFVSYILLHKSVEKISTQNSTTIYFKWHDLDGFALGIVVKWISLAQHKTELFTMGTFRQLYLCVYTVMDEKLKTEGLLLNNNMSYEATDPD